MARKWKNLKKNKLKLIGFKKKCILCEYLNIKHQNTEKAFHQCIKLNIKNFNIYEHEFCEKFLFFRYGIGRRKQK